MLVYGVNKDFRESSPILGLKYQLRVYSSDSSKLLKVFFSITKERIIVMVAEKTDCAVKKAARKGKLDRIGQPDLAYP